MVTPSGGSRPAALNQRQVDDLVRGKHEDAARLLRSHRSEPPLDVKRSTEAGSRPMELSATDMEAIRRSGVVPGELIKRIAAGAQPEQSTQRKVAGKATASSEPAAGYPTAQPPRDTK